MRSIFTAFRIFLISLLFLSAGGVHGEQLVQEDFESPFLADQSRTVGRPGTGWVQPPSGENLVYPVSLADAEVGMISFDLQRLAAAGTSGVGTVFELLDDEGHRVVRMQVNWSASGGGTALFINSLPSRDYLTYGIRLWGPTIYLGREVAPGDWVHVDLVWDDVRGEYQAYADGAPIKTGADSLPPAPERKEAIKPRLFANEEAKKRGEPLPYPEMPFRFFLERVTSLALGNFPIPNLPEGRARTLMTNSALDNFEIRVGYLTSIASVTHDAFAVAGYSGMLVAGDTFTAKMTAQPGGVASFEIAPPEPEPGKPAILQEAGLTDIPMVEDPDSPGTYSGTYTVGFGQHLEDGRLLGSFRNSMGYEAPPLQAERPIRIDGRVRLSVKASGDLMPADLSSRVGFTVAASDANGKPVKDHPLHLTLSTTDEYTGIVGGGTFKGLVGGEIDVDWGGVTDSFGEVSAQYVSGFAAKTILVSAKDLVSGDVGVGWVRSFIEGSVDILVREKRLSALSVAGSMDVSLSREWVTADGVSRSRITAVVRDAGGFPLPGHSIRFTLLGSNGSIRAVQGTTDSRGRAYADYIAGILMGQVQVEVRDLTSGMVAIVSVELRPDAPARIVLTADPGEIEVEGASVIQAVVTDANGNPNSDVDVIYSIFRGSGDLASDTVPTDDEGVASVTFTAGENPGLVTVRGNVVSRVPTQEEVSAAEGALFLHGLTEDPGKLVVARWLVKPGQEVLKGLDLVILEDRSGSSFTVRSPRDGIMSVFTAEEKDRVEYGQTLGYVIQVSQ